MSEFSNHYTGKDMVPETEAETVRKRNAKRIDAEKRTRAQVRRSIEDRQIAKEFGVNPDDL